MANEGMLMLVGLGALLLLGGRGGKEKPTIQETITGSGSGFPGMFGPEAPSASPASPAFDIAGYIQSVFAETATAPKQPPVQFFQPPPVVVTSSGVPAIITSKPEIITATTKVAIGGDAGQTITASALAVKRTEQIKQQQFQAAANVQPKTWPGTAAANLIEEARQRTFADQLIAAAREAQRKRNAVVEAKTRIEQENINKGLNPDGTARSLPAGMSVIGAPVGAGPPTINWDEDDGDWSYSYGEAGQDIAVSGGGVEMDVDFTPAPEYSESFVISGGMDSPMAAEDEQPSGVTVHELAAQYDIGF